MNKTSVLAFLDSEIERLTHARQILSGGNGLEARTSRASRTAGTKKSKRHLSTEARKRISEAQKRRWAARQKAAK